MSLATKVAIVTGGASGIGKALVESLLKRGAKVCIADISTTSGTQAVEELSVTFGKDSVIFVQCDVTSRESLMSVFDKTTTTFGCIDMVFNNAGIADEINWEQTIQINLNGVVYGTKLAFDYMSKARGGKGGLVINTTSVRARYPNGCPVYNATKAAIANFTVSMSKDFHYKKHGVRVNAIGPTQTTSALFRQLDVTAIDQEAFQKREPLPGPIEPSVVSEACMALVEDESRNGEVMLIWGEDDREYITYPDPSSRKT